MKKQAVVVVHGMGEQRPMDTIRDFVNGVWKQDEGIENPHFWSVPSQFHQSYEQRVYTTNRTHQHQQSPSAKVDFIEFYWAHHTSKTILETLSSWVKSLIFKFPVAYNRHRIGYLWWFITSVFLALIIFPVLFALFSGSESIQINAINSMFLGSTVNLEEAASDDSFNYKVLLDLGLALGFFVAALAQGVLVRYLGDVARYVRANPDSIQARQAIRKSGVTLLKKLMQSGEYERVVLVSHSLGTVVALDILTQLWAQHVAELKKLRTVAQVRYSQQLAKVQALQHELAETAGFQLDTQQEYQRIQKQLFFAINQLTEFISAHHPEHKPTPWLISDFITLGSPLTYADFLIAKDMKDLQLKFADRMLPTSPPQKVNKCFLDNRGHYFHHGAVFAPVLWHNIYARHRRVYQGDIVSGPVSPLFSFLRGHSEFVGPEGVNQHLTKFKASFENVKRDYYDGNQQYFSSPITEIRVFDESSDFNHQNYWQWRNDGENSHLLILRELLNFFNWRHLQNQVTEEQNADDENH